jgi:hypothetical protein
VARSLPGCKGKREAQHECARILTEMQSGGYVAPDKTTVAQFLERWLAHIKTQVGPGSFQRYGEYGCQDRRGDAGGPEQTQDKVRRIG